MPWEESCLSLPHPDWPPRCTGLRAQGFPEQSPRWRRGGRKFPLFAPHQLTLGPLFGLSLT